LVEVFADKTLPLRIMLDIRDFAILEESLSGSSIGEDGQPSIDDDERVEQ